MIINIVDATNLSRSLFFTTQLLELDIPVVVALNKSDINEKKGTKIDVQALAGGLGCTVVETASTSAAPPANGLGNVTNAAVEAAGKGQKDLLNKEISTFIIKRKWRLPTVKDLSS